MSKEYVTVPLEKLREWMDAAQADWESIDLERGPTRGGLEAALAGGAPGTQHIKEMRVIEAATCGTSAALAAAGVKLAPFGFGDEVHWLLAHITSYITAREQQIEELTKKLNAQVDPQPDVPFKTDAQSIRQELFNLARREGLGLTWRDRTVLGAAMAALNRLEVDTPRPVGCGDGHTYVVTTPMRWSDLPPAAPPAPCDGCTKLINGRCMSPEQYHDFSCKSVAG